MLINDSILKKFLKENNAEFALITNYFGDIITSVNVTQPDSIAAMSSAILSMCDKYLEDLEKNSLIQLIIKTTDAVIVFSKIDNGTVLVILAKAGANLGMFLHQTELLTKKLN